MQPLINEKYYYTGLNSDYFTNGKRYKVVETGQHWFKEWGEGAWMTTDEYPNTSDVDYACFVPYKEFGKHKRFEKY